MDYGGQKQSMKREKLWMEGSFFTFYGGSRQEEMEGKGIGKGVIKTLGSGRILDVVVVAEVVAVVVVVAVVTAAMVVAAAGDSCGGSDEGGGGDGGP